MPESISFDRAASFYDETRKLEEERANAITDTLSAELRNVGTDRLLEVGVGTGRISRPLMAHGIRVTGLDISTQMMGRLLAQLTPAHTPPDLLIGDATRLPFRDNSFRAMLVVHVLHLVSSAGEAIREIQRVLEPGGVLLQQNRRPDEATGLAWREHDEFWDARCAERGFQRRHRAEKSDIDELLPTLGAVTTEIEVGSAVHTSTVEEELDHLRARRHSWMWLIPDEILDANVGDFEGFLRHGADADGRFDDHVTYLVQVTRWP